MSEYTLTYTQINTSFGVAVSEQAPLANTIPAAANATYAIATKKDTTPKMHAGITIDANGVILVTKEVPAGIYQLTITATATEIVYTGSKTAEVIIIVIESIDAYTVSYGSITTETGTAISGEKAKAPTTTIPVEAKVFYTIDTKIGTAPAKDSGITIDGNTGGILVTAAVPKGYINLPRLLQPQERRTKATQLQI